MIKTRGNASCAKLLMLLCLTIVLAASPYMAARADQAEWDHLSFEAMHEFKVFGIESGLPFLGYMTVAQTPDGFMYAGGYGGLVRYDGKRFERLKGIDSVVSLYVAKNGCLWIGTNSGRLVRMSDGDKLTFYGKEDGLDVVGIRAICEDAAGNLIFGTDSGVYVMDAAESIRLIGDERLDACYVNQMSCQDGTVYGSDYDGNVFVIRDLRVAYYLESETIPKSVQTVFADAQREGYIYIGSTGSEILHGQLGQSPDTYDVIDAKGLLNIYAIYQVEDRLWITSDGGVGFLETDGTFHKLADPAFNSEVSMCVDYEGNLWFASSRNGLIRISKSNFADLNQIAALDERVVNTTWMKDGLLYVGTDTGLLVLNSKGGLVRNELYERLGNTRIRSIKEDRAGNLWLCTFSDYGLVCQSADGTFTCYTQEQGMLSNYIRTVYEMRDGTIAVSATGGVQLLRDGAIYKTYDQSAGIPTTSILSLCEDFEGRLLLGTNGRGLYMIDGDRVIPCPIQDDMDSGVVMGIKRDDRRECFWIITGGMLSCLKDGVARPLTGLPDELSANGCYDVLCSDNEKVFLLCNTGVFVMDGDALIAGSAAEYEYYNSKNGLPHMVTPNSRSYVDGNGDAYIACSDGVTRLNINTDLSSGVTPRLNVAFIDVNANQQLTRVTDGEMITVPANTRRLNIYPYVLYYGLGDPKVTYCLEGFDPAPMRRTKQDLEMVSYTNLPGGTYTFRLNLEEAPNGYSGVSITIVKLKAIYEQPVFWIAVALAVLLMIGWIVRMMLKQQARALERKAKEEAQQKEEERITKELNMAASIQAGALPNIFPAFPDRKEFDIYATMTPAKEVGGDFYDFFMVDDNHLGMVIADVSDKGVPAALFMMSAKTIIASHARMGKSPKETLMASNAALCVNNAEKMFVTVWLGILELSSGKLVCSNAGHEYPAIRGEDGVFRIFRDKHGLMVGGYAKAKYTEYELTLAPGDAVFVYTDGVPEANNAAGEFYGMERLEAVLGRASQASPKGILESVKADVDRFVNGAKQFDDLTMLCVEYHGAQSSGE